MGGSQSTESLELVEMIATTEFTIERNGQTVAFHHHAGPVGKMGDPPDIEQVSLFKNQAGIVQPLKDYLIDGVHVRASNNRLAHQALREWLDNSEKAEEDDEPCSAEVTTRTEWTVDFYRSPADAARDLGVTFRTHEDLQRYIDNAVFAGIPSESFGVHKSRTVTTITSPWEAKD